MNGLRWKRSLCNEANLEIGEPGRAAALCRMIRTIPRIGIISRFAAEFAFEFGVGDLDHCGAAVGAAVGELAF